MRCEKARRHYFETSKKPETPRKIADYETGHAGSIPEPGAEKQPCGPAAAEILEQRPVEHGALPV
jgi:hypothetical protein